MADSRPADVAERVTVAVPAADAYQAISDVRRIARWSPECFAVRTTLARLKRELDGG